jgi:hypothetical protein
MGTFRRPIKRSLRREGMRGEERVQDGIFSYVSL